MTSAREIVTLQLGDYSNFVGAHWWNIQESGFDYSGKTVSEINHDVLFREGLTNLGHVTYTPRLVLLDLKGSLSHLPQAGELYENPTKVEENTVLWPKDKLEVIKEPPAEKNEFLQNLETKETADGVLYNFEASMRKWPDILVSRYHPNTMCISNEYESSIKPFDIFNYGIHLWKSQEFQDDFIERIRKFIEECDNFQGFHLLMDGTDGFSGVGVGLVQYLEDEYANKSVLAFPNIPASPAATPVADCIRTINLSLLFPKLSEYSSLFVPLCLGSNGWRQPGPPREFTHLKYNNALPFHTSAILASALDTLTLSYRMREGQTTRLADVCNSLSRVGRKAAAASVGLPFSMPADRYLLDVLEKWEGPLWQSLTPNCSLNEDRIWIQSIVLRGITKDKLRSPSHKFQGWNPAYRCTTVQEMMSLFLSCCSYATASFIHTADFPCKVIPPFPNIFTEEVSQDGYLNSIPRQEQCGVKSIPVIAGLHSSRSVGDMLEILHSHVKKLKMHQFHQFVNSGLECDEFSENLDQLLDLRECYHEEFSV